MSKKIILLFMILLILSSCSAPTDQTLNGDAGETTSTSINEDTTSTAVDVEPAFIVCDLNYDGVEERIVIDTSSESATIQIQQTREGGNLTLADIPFSNSETGGYYFRRGKNNNYDELLYWNYSIIDGSRLVFKYEVFSFDSNGEKEHRKREAKTFDLGSDAMISSESIVFSTLQSTLNSFLVSDHSYDVFVLIENRGNGVLYSTADNLIKAEEILLDLRDFLKNA